MKLFYFLFAVALFLGVADFNLSDVNKDHPRYTIVLHGGVGTISKDMPDSLKVEYLKSLSDALIIGKNILENGHLSIVLKVLL